MAWSIPGYARPLLDLIAKHESQGSYSSVVHLRGEAPWGDLTKMTLSELYERQKAHLRGAGRGSSAVGRYQIVSRTLFDGWSKAPKSGLIHQLKIPMTTTFSRELQDFLAWELVKSRGLNSFLKGASGSAVAFMDALSKEWESLPNRRGVQTNGKRSPHAVETVNATLAQMRSAAKGVASVASVVTPLIKQAPKAALAVAEAIAPIRPLKPEEADHVSDFARRSWARLTGKSPKSPVVKPAPKPFGAELLALKAADQAKKSERVVIALPLPKLTPRVDPDPVEKVISSTSQVRSPSAHSVAPTPPIGVEIDGPVTMAKFSNGWFYSAGSRNYFRRFDEHEWRLISGGGPR